MSRLKNHVSQTRVVQIFQMFFPEKNRHEEARNILETRLSQFRLAGRFWELGR